MNFFGLFKNVNRNSADTLRKIFGHSTVFVFFFFFKISVDFCTVHSNRVSVVGMCHPGTIKDGAYNPNTIRGAKSEGGESGRTSDG